MAHRTTQRRTLAGADSKASSMDPTTTNTTTNTTTTTTTTTTFLKRQPKPTKPFHHPNPDPITFPSYKPSMEISISTSNLSKSLNSDHRIRRYQKPTSQNPPISAIVDSSKKKSFLCKVEKTKLFKEEEDFEEVVQKMASLKSSEEGQKKKKKCFGVVERRRSLCGTPHVELADVFASNGVKVVSADMPPFMQIHAVECARKTHDSLEKFTSKTLASTLKKEFDGVYGPAWHCIVGTSFGSFVTHSVGGFLYFSMDQKLYILLFKTTVQRAD